MMSSYIFVRVTAAVRAAVPILRIVYLWGCIKYFKEDGNRTLFWKYKLVEVV
jgi:hypothetical protein